MGTALQSEAPLHHRGSEVGMKVSVVIPVYNERAFIEEILLRVQAVALDKEIVVIDDRSTDGTLDLLREFEQAAGRPEQREVAVQKRQSRAFRWRISSSYFRNEISVKGPRSGGGSRLPAET